MRHRFSCASGAALGAPNMKLGGCPPMPSALPTLHVQTKTSGRQAGVAARPSLHYYGLADSPGYLSREISPGEATFYKKAGELPEPFSAGRKALLMVNVVPAKQVVSTRSWPDRRV